MHQIKNSFIDFFKSDDIRVQLHEMMRNIFSMIYNEIYVYIWIIAIYSIFSFFILLAILFGVLHLFTLGIHPPNIYIKESS